MGHAIHFLTRLERLEDEQQLELAKSLYRDSGLLAHVLGRARLPEGCDRAALSLGPGAGPYLVVTRDGGFVTCLGEGMTTGALPVIARAHLDALAAESQTLRERLALARELAGGRDEKRLLHLLMRGRYLSREQFLALSALQPIFMRSLPGMLRAIDESHRGSRASLISLTSREPERLTRAQREMLVRTSASMWATGHIALLAASGRRDALEEAMTAGNPSEYTVDSRRMFTPALRFQEIGIRMRAALAIAKVGKPCLAAAKRRHLGQGSASDKFEGIVALPALAARHRALRAEIAKVYSNGPAEAGRSIAQRMEAGDRMFGAMAAAGEEYLVSAGRSAYAYLTRRLASDSAFRFDRPEDVPPDLAIALFASALQPPSVERFDGTQFLFIVAGAARRKPEDLYLPGEVLESLTDPAEHDSEMVDAWFCLRGSFERVGKREPVQVDPRPARNEACGCGSGKKFKRCCGSAAATG